MIRESQTQTQTIIGTYTVWYSLSIYFSFSRRWVVIDQKNSIVNQKQKPTMTLIKTSIRLGRNGDEDETVVSVNAPGMFELTLRPLPKKEQTDENLRLVIN